MSVMTAPVFAMPMLNQLKRNTGSRWGCSSFVFWSHHCFVVLPWVGRVWTAMSHLLWLCTGCFQGLWAGPPYCYMANYKRGDHRNRICFVLFNKQSAARWKRMLWKGLVFLIPQWLLRVPKKTCQYESSLQRCWHHTIERETGGCWRLHKSEEFWGRRGPGQCSLDSHSLFPESTPFYLGNACQICIFSGLFVQKCS